MNESARRAVVRAAATEIHWRECGQGPAVVLLHGLSDSHRTWSRVAPRLARTHRVLMPDLPGHGLSGRPDASYALSWHAAAVAEWLDGLGLERFDVVGHSFGGGVAQCLLLLARQRIGRLALVGAGGLGRKVSWPLRLATLPVVVEHLGQPFMRVGTRVVSRAIRADFDPVETAALAGMNARPGSARALARTARDVIGLRGQRRCFFDRAHELPELPPIGLFWGERDRLIPVAHAVDFLERVEGATLVRFPDCGHFPHRECPEAFTAALEEFLTAPALPPARLRPELAREAALPRPPLRRLLGAFAPRAALPSGLRGREAGRPRP